MAISILTESIPTKRCIECRELQPLEYFRLTGRGDNRRSICRNCTRLQTAITNRGWNGFKRTKRKIEREKFLAMFPDLKYCQKGDHFLSKTNFVKSQDRDDGLSSTCKGCRKSFREANKDKIQRLRKKYLEENRELIKERQRLSYHRNKTRPEVKQKRRLSAKKYRGKNKQKQKAYYQDHSEIIRKRSHKRYHSNPAAILERQKDYYQRNRDRYKVMSRNRKARVRAAQGKYTPQQWQEKLDFWGRRCYYCRTSLEGQTIHQEHRIPITRGGTNWIANIVPSCAKCNLTKHTRTETEFRQLLAA